MNFGNFDEIGWVVEKYLATHEGQDEVKKYLTSPEGIAMLQKFVGTPDGKKTVLSILPQILSGLDLPPGVVDTINSAIGSR
jgi:hypothetical protein